MDGTPTVTGDPTEHRGAGAAPSTADCAETRVETWCRLLLVAGLAAAAITTVAGVFLLTLGYDEAWILHGLLDVVRPRHPDIAVASVPTSGGFFAAAQLAISYFADNAVWAHRLFSTACLASMAALLVAWFRKPLGSTTAALAIPAVLVAIPGTLVLGSTAMAAVPATLLAVSGVILWDRLESSRRIRWIACGLLFGLAAATRLELVTLFPSLLVWALIFPQGRRSRVVDAAVACAIGALVLAVGMASMNALAGHHPDAEAVKLDNATGLARSWLNYPRLLNKFVIGESFLPIGVMTLATVVAVAVVRSAGASRPCWLALVPCGWTVYLAWVVRSPNANLRYLWPALVCFGIVLGVGLGRLYQWGRSNGSVPARIAALSIALACVVSGLGAATRSLILGESNFLSWEGSREMRIANFSWFQQVRDQRAAAQYLTEHVAPGEDVGVVGLDFELRYLTGRRLIALHDMVADADWRPADLPSLLVIPPIVGTYLRLNPAGHRWIETNCKLEAEIGQYCFYRVVGEPSGGLRCLVPVVNMRPTRPLVDPLRADGR